MCGNSKLRRRDAFCAVVIAVLVAVCDKRGKLLGQTIKSPHENVNAGLTRDIARGHSL